MHERTIRKVTWAVLPFVIWTFAGGPAYAANADQESSRESSRVRAPQVSPRQFDDVVGEMETALRSIADGDDDSLETIKSLREEIRGRNDALRQEFADVEAMILDKSLPAEILQRHRDFVSQYEARFAEVESGLTKVETGTIAPEGFFSRAWFKVDTWISGDTERTDAARDTAEFLEGFSQKKARKSFQPDELPFRRLLPQENNKPKESAEEWQRALDPVGAETTALRIAIGTIGNALIPVAHAQSNDAPGPEDLAETTEVQFTADIVDLAAQLNNNPVEIYNWVRTNIISAPTWGSIQGADYCLQTRECNAFDTSSLLIALLRVSGIPAKYQFGTIELTDEVARNWLGGFDTLLGAGTFAAAAGTPTSLFTKLDGTQTLRLDHVWARVYLDYLPSQGPLAAAGGTAIDLDATYKQYAYADPMSLSALTSVDIDALVVDVHQSATIDAGTGALLSLDLTQIESAIDTMVSDISQSATALPADTTSGEIVGFRQIITAELPVLPTGLPYAVPITGPSLSAIPQSLQHTISISFGGDELTGDPAQFTYSRTLSELAGSRVSLEFVAASAVDTAAVDAYLSSLDISSGNSAGTLPVSLANLVPNLKIDGNTVTSGFPMRLGTAGDLSIRFGAPGAATPEIRNEINAGELVAIGLDIARISAKQLRQRADEFAALEQMYLAAEADPLAPIVRNESYRSALFSAAVETWFSHVDLLKDISYRASGTAWARYPSAGTFFSDLAPEPLFGVPWRVRATGLVMDIDRNLSIAESKVGDEAALIDATLVQGMAGSALEGLVPLYVLGFDPEVTTSHSSAAVLFESLTSGIPIFELDASNFDSLKDQIVIDPGSLADISNAIAAGNKVIVPQMPLALSDKTISAFVAFDPETGAGEYIVGQSFSGAVIASNTQAEVAKKTLGDTFGVLLDLATDDVFKSSIRQSFGKIAGIFGSALKFLSLLEDLVKIYYDPIATVSQKIAAVAIISGVLIAVTLVGSIATALAGPAGAFLVNFLAGYLFDYIKDVLLKQVCATCFQ